LIKDIQAQRQMGVLFITHDFGVVAEIADRVAVMQEGRLVELGAARDVLSKPEHPYTRALISAVPALAPKPGRRTGTEAPVALQVEGLEKTFRSGGGLFGARPRVVRAVRHVSFAIRHGETLGVV